MSESGNATRGHALLKALEQVAAEDNDPDPYVDYHYDLRRQYRVTREIKKGSNHD